MPVDLQKMISLAGNLPLDLTADAKVIDENFCSDNVAVLVTNKSAGVKHGTHSHDSNEFVICYSRLTTAIIDNISYIRERNTIFAVNPMQEHGITDDVKDFSLCGIHINKNMVRNVSMSIYGSPEIIFSNDSFEISHDLRMLVRLFLEELKYKQSGYQYMVENISLLLIGCLMRQINHNLSSTTPLPISDDEASIKAAIDYMNENYTSGISCTELASLIKMDKFCFIRCFKAKTGKTPYEYLLDLKIEKAKKMLKANTCSITEVSMLCGFSSHSHFTSTFRKRAGISPTEYKLNS